MASTVMLMARVGKMISQGACFHHAPGWAAQHLSPGDGRRLDTEAKETQSGFAENDRAEL
jgi:hypothetical protein